MVSQNELLVTTQSLDQLGNGISLTMVEFLNKVQNQPLDFRELGLDFLGICKIVGTLRTSLEEHFQTNQPFPERAVPELTKVLMKTTDDFNQLQKLLQKFMDYENGGTFARLQKTWRQIFADKEIAKVSQSLKENRGTLNMAMLLTNIHPDGAGGGIGYSLLADRLNHTEHHELDGNSYAGSVLAPTMAFEDSDKIAIPSISELSIDDGLIPVEAESPRSPVSSMTFSSPDDAVPQKRLQQMNKREVIKVDRSKIVKRVPRSAAGASSDALKRTLISAVEGQKDAIVETLLDRGVPPDTGKEKNAVIIATRNRDTPTLKLLLEFGADPDAPDAGGYTALRVSCSNREEQCKVLLDSGADPNTSAPDWTALGLALNDGQETIRALLLQYGADPNVVSKNGMTAMVYACSKGSADLVKELIDCGGDPNQKNCSGLGHNSYTALEQACQSQNSKVIEVLLAHGANPNLRGSELPIRHCIGNPDCLELLLRGGANPSECNGILELATWKGSIEVVRLLLDAGLDPNEQKDKLFRPLTTAIRDNHFEILKLLISRGANPNLKGEDFPLSMATRRPGMLKYLIEEAEADLTKCPQALELAVWRGNLDSISILLDAGVSPNQLNPNDMSPLTTAIRDKHVEIMSFLLSKGADPNLKGQGFPLEIALPQPALMKLLLAAGADVDRVPGILELAVWRNNLDTIKLLLEHGVSVNQVNPNGHVPLATAIRDNHKEVFEFLLANGADPNLRPSILENAVHKSAFLLPLLRAGADPRKTLGILEVAVWRNNIEAVRILLDEGRVDINEKRPSGHGPVTTAVRDKHIEILAELLSRKPDLNATTCDGVPLVKAAQYPETKLLEMILDAGGNVDVQQADGTTALMNAAWHGRKEIVQVLMKRGANTELVNNKGLGAIDIAANRGHEDIVITLLEGMG